MTINWVDMQYAIGDATLEATGIWQTPTIATMESIIEATFGTDEIYRWHGEKSDMKLLLETGVLEKIERKEAG